MLRQLDIGSTDIFLESMQLGRARNRHDVRALRKQPSERDLRRRCALFATRLSRSTKAWFFATASGGNRGTLLRKSFAGSLVSLSSRRSGSPCPAGCRARSRCRARRRLEDAVGLGGAPPERIFVLNGGDRLHGMGAAERLDARLRQAEVPDLALGDQVVDGAGHILDRHVRIDPVLVKEVDRLDAEALQRAVDRLADALGPAVDAPVLARLESISKPNLVAMTT